MGVALLVTRILIVAVFALYGVLQLASGMKAAYGILSLVFALANYIIFFKT